MCDGIASILGGHPALDVVGIVGDAAGAVCLAESLAPTVVLLDASLPGARFADVLRSIRANGRSRVIAMGVHESEVDAAREAGADCVLLKDVDRGALLRCVLEVVQGP